MSAYEHAEDLFLSYLTQENMLEKMRGGVLLALSGGKDSVLLLRFLSSLSKKEDFPLAAFHLNHGIRGEEASSDEAFCRALCDSIGVPFSVCYADVPALAVEWGMGIEQAARRERYRLLDEERVRLGFSAVATAHTATDTLETLLLYMLRGGGGQALCGIPSTRRLGHDGILLRPLLSLTAEQVTSALDAREYSYVTDSTNADLRYRRNFLRSRVLPLLGEISPCPERAAQRMCENVRADMACLDRLAETHFSALYDGKTLNGDALLSLESALSFRVLRLYHATSFPGAPSLERTHTDAFFAALSRPGDFSLSVPGSLVLGRERGRVFLREEGHFCHPDTLLSLGANRLADGALLVLVKDAGVVPKNIYSLSIHASLSSAKMVGSLCVRSRRDGDAYRYGGMTHKLKKLFSDRKLSRLTREHLPVICDGTGIVWVPGFGVRDDGGKSSLYALYFSPERVTDGLLAHFCEGTAIE